MFSFTRSRSQIRLRVEKFPEPEPPQNRPAAKPWLEQTEKISFRFSSVLSKVEADLHNGSGSDQKVPAPQDRHTVQYIHDMEKVLVLTSVSDPDP